MPHYFSWQRCWGLCTPSSGFHILVPSTFLQHYFTLFTKTKYSFIKKHLWLILAVNCGLTILFLQKSLVLLLQWQSASMATAGCCHFLEMYPSSGALTIISNSFTLPFCLSFWFSADLLFEASSILPLPFFQFITFFQISLSLLSLDY